MSNPSAAHIAVSAYEQALEAVEREEEAKRRQEERERAEFSERVEATLKHAQRLLGTIDWFPGAKWRVWDDRAGAPGAATGYGSGNTLVITDEPNGEIRLLVVRTLIDMNAPDAGFKMRVYFPALKSDRDTGYSYWDGPEVKNAADVGRCLKAAGNPLASDRHVV